MANNKIPSAGTTAAPAVWDKYPKYSLADCPADGGSPVVFGGDPDNPVFVDPEYWYVGAPPPPPGYRPPWENPQHPDYPSFHPRSQVRLASAIPLRLPDYRDLEALDAELESNAAIEMKRRKRSVENLERSIRTAPWYGRDPALAVEYDGGLWLTHGALASLLARIIANAPGDTWTASADAQLVDEMFETGFPVFVRKASASSDADSEGFLLTLIRPAAVVVQHALDHVLGSCAPYKGDVR